MNTRLNDNLPNDINALKQLVLVQQDALHDNQQQLVKKTSTHSIS
jgi:hypothetical protein